MPWLAHYFNTPLDPVQFKKQTTYTELLRLKAVLRVLTERDGITLKLN